MATNSKKSIASTWSRSNQNRPSSLMLTLALQHSLTRLNNLLLASNFTGWRKMESGFKSPIQFLQRLSMGWRTTSNPLLSTSIRSKKTPCTNFASYGTSLKLKMMSLKRRLASINTATTFTTKTTRSPMNERTDDKPVREPPNI